MICCSTRSDLTVRPTNFIRKGREFTVGSISWQVAPSSSTPTTPSYTFHFTILFDSNSTEVIKPIYWWLKINGFAIIFELFFRIIKIGFLQNELEEDDAKINKKHKIGIWLKKKRERSQALWFHK